MSRRTFKIPDDLERMQALGLAVPSPKGGIESRLDYVAFCIEHGLVPDARGKRGEPSPGSVAAWQAVPVPAELEPHMSDLAQGVAYCRARLEAGELEEAQSRRVGVEALIVSMGETLARSVRPRRGGEARRGTRKCPRIYEWIVGQLEQDPGATNDQLAERFPQNDLQLYQGEYNAFAEGDFSTSSGLNRAGFNRYATAARKQLRIARQSPSRTT